jgi:predicted outer membrane repeat protein
MNSATHLEQRGPRLLRPHTVIAAVALLLAAGTAAASQRDVCPSGCTYSTVQSAVDAAASGDVINIGAGRYVENVTIVGKNLQLIGADNATTVVDGGWRGSVFTLGSIDMPAVNSQVSISQITVTHGKSAGGGGGFLISNGVAVTLSGVIVIHNVSQDFGGGVGIQTQTEGPIVLVGCAVDNNKSLKGGGGGISISGGTLRIDGGTITRNAASVFGGGLFVGGIRGAASAVVTLTNSTVVDNKTRASTPAAQGGGIYVESVGQLDISNTTIARNTSTTDGGGLYAEGRTTVKNSVIARNSALGNGGGVSWNWPSGGTAFENVYIVQNSAAHGGGVWAAEPFRTAGYAKIENNVPTNCEGSSCP